MTVVAATFPQLHCKPQYSVHKCAYLVYVYIRGTPILGVNIKYSNFILSRTSSHIFDISCSKLHKNPTKNKDFTYFIAERDKKRKKIWELIRNFIFYKSNPCIITHKAYPEKIMKIGQKMNVLERKNRKIAIFDCYHPRFGPRFWGFRVVLAP